MDFYKVPIGFGLALAANEPAMQAYSAMSETEKQTIINKATMSALKRKCTTWWPLWQTICSKRRAVIDCPSFIVPSGIHRR